MCRSFPNGKQCPYAACEWDAVNGEDAAPESSYVDRDIAEGREKLGPKYLERERANRLPIVD